MSSFDPQPDVSGGNGDGGGSDGTDHEHSGTSGASGLPTGALAATLDRRSVNAGAALPANQLHVSLIELVAGMEISSITFVAHAGSVGGGLHQWFALYDVSGALLAVTEDDTNAQWTTGAPASMPKTLALPASYVVPTTGFYYVGVFVRASSVPQMAGAPVVPGVGKLDPVMSFADPALNVNGPETAPAQLSFPPAWPSNNVFYAYVS